MPVKRRSFARTDRLLCFKSSKRRACGARPPPTMAENEEVHTDAQESLQRVTDLLRRQQIVEGLVRRQEGPRQELVENLVQKLHVVELQKLPRYPASGGRRRPPRGAAARGAARRLGPRQDRPRGRDPARGVRRGARNADRAHGRGRAGRRRPNSSIPTRSPTSRPTCRGRSSRTFSSPWRRTSASSCGPRMSYEEGTVGALMDFDMISIREDVTARSGAALPAASGRAARPHRPAVRGRPRRAR